MYYHSHRDENNKRFWLEIWGVKFLFEVAWFVRFCHIKFGYDDESGWLFGAGLPPVSFWFHVQLPRPFRLKESREVDFSIHNGALYWHIWRDPMGGWDRSVPKWRDSAFHFDDFLFGKSVYSETPIETRDILVPMPEKAYSATAKLFDGHWKRPRWFKNTIRRCEIKIPDGIPHEGKGENSYDCGQDATFGMTTGRVKNIAEAVGVLVGHVLNDRVRYGGWGDWNWQKPPEKK